MEKRKEVTVNYKGAQHFIQLEVEGAAPHLIHERISLRDKSGALHFTLPKGMVPFANVGDSILVSITFVQGEIVEISPILRPDAIIIPAKN